MLVEGAILDAEGARPSYVRIEHGIVVETGAIGTDSTRGKERKIRGIVTPSPVNGHTHLGDAISTREPPNVSFSELVSPPSGYKFRLLSESKPGAKRRAMRAALDRMRHEGIAGTIDFREEGEPGVRELRRAAEGAGVRVVILGRPVGQPRESAEIERILEVADGIGISSAREESAEVRHEAAAVCRTKRKFYALHASEEIREPPEVYLDPRPDLIVHLTRAEPSDLEQVRDAGTSIAVCPRSNALFGRRPLLGAMEKVGNRVLVGTDNAMLQSPSIWRELEFAYITSRLHHEPASAMFLARAALVEPWRWLGEEERGHLIAGGPAVPLVFRLPPEDPAYQIVTRATEHLMVQPARRVAPVPESESIGEPPNEE
ncbi:MAG: amidohydrolase family protein [Thermoplasmata archaeon]